MSYNFAALRGGGIQDAINRLCGGWAVPAVFPLPGVPVSAGAEEQEDMDDVKAYILDKYDFADKTVLDEAVDAAFSYDSALMRGQREYLSAMQARFKQNPDFKKLVDYVRRVAHRGDSKPAKLTKAQRKERSRIAAEKRIANAGYLASSRWYGSNPYVEGTRHTMGNYSGLYLPGKRPKGYTPSWYGPLNMARARYTRTRTRLPPVIVKDEEKFMI